MSEFTVAGSRIFIGGVLEPTVNPWVPSDFDSQVWVPIAGWFRMGRFGNQSNILERNLINQDIVTKQKGTFNPGTMSNAFTWRTGDPGQEALIAASETRFSYAVKIELPDTPVSGSAPTPTTYLMTALISGAPVDGGESETFLEMSVDFGINARIVRVPAATGP